MTLKQSINLISSQELQQKTQLDDVVKFYMTSAACLFLLFVSWGSAGFKLKTLNANLKNQKLQHQTLVDELNVIKPQIDSILNDEVAKNKLAQMNASLEHKKYLLSFLQTLQTPKKASILFEGLANNADGSIQLETIEFGNQSNSLFVKGLTRDSIQVAHWLERLKTDENFEGIKFERFVIKSQEDTKNLTFEINSLYEPPRIP